ncbi:hypothetical protein [Conexibacter sp. SYSU D00693]|uniref:hypothetical protein n=1 Tax=Conexibacter sp. SYSU D00693 TaxID=2812560 RepID=UPI00196AC128|nr:hypothetical protein [Conexibacter sp. SYSU D00693]
MATTPTTDRPATGGATDLGRGSSGTGRRQTTETKAAFMTTEFFSYLLTFALLLIAGNAVEGNEGGSDYFAADKVWLYITILTVGYMVSRGLAKSGSREPYYRGGTNEMDDRPSGGRFSR